MELRSMKRAALLLNLHFMLLACLMLTSAAVCREAGRKTGSFTKNWKFSLGNFENAQNPAFIDKDWRNLNLPHDWSIEGEFRKDNPASPGGGALPGGTGWYRKTFTVPAADRDKSVFIEFDGIYRNSEVWINGHYLGKRPYGYISFRYELTPFLNFGDKENLIAVKVDNSQQPNSRWYSGSGIYRNVRLVTAGKIHVDHWGTCITTPEVKTSSARVQMEIKVRNAGASDQHAVVNTIIYDNSGTKVSQWKTSENLPRESAVNISHEFNISNPALWSIETPRLYKAVTQVLKAGRTEDTYETVFGIRTFSFDSANGFSLNGKNIKINGVCNHHDLGCLGSAVNYRAIERQLEIMKNMGVNAIRTSHNPPAPELLELCDKMGFIVMDEAFDMWKKGKTKFDYSLDWDEWHRRDLEDFILRDRNHPSVIMWSIGNEINEQWDKKDSSGFLITKELVSIIKSLDKTRPVTAACNDHDVNNPLVKAGALDVIGLNYDQNDFIKFPAKYPGQKFVASETVSALATRGSYDMPSDSIKRWPPRWDLPVTNPNPGNTCSSYDNCATPWGSTHEETWRIIKKYPYLSGQFIWTGFDYLGEPTPYDWPSRSSYFGVVDLAGFPKDAFYLYQSEWTDKTVLHIFPHWNWKQGDTVDVWAYTNCEEVELFLNGESLGIKKKGPDDLHLMWRLIYKPGVLKAAGRKAGREVMTDIIRTAGKPSRLLLEADRKNINAGGNDLSFISVKVTDENGVTVPNADNLINFSISGNGEIAGVDNGSQISHEPFKASRRKAFNGMCLAVIRSGEEAGIIRLKASAEGLKDAEISINTIKDVSSK